MSSSGSRSVGPDTSYWHQRGREEAHAALASDDPRIAAIHVELATHCLRMARQGAPASPATHDFDFAAENL